MTMQDILYMGMKNDASFLLTDTANMYEQQSTYNLNMPVRKLMYAARLYDRYIRMNKLNIYSIKQIRLPVPKPVTFYNGKEEREYAWFISEIRKRKQSIHIESAVDGALDAMLENFALKKFLIANKAEVKQMCITEYNEAETMEQFRTEGRVEGRKEGIADGDLLRLIRTVCKKMLKGRTNEEIADDVEESTDLIGQIKEAILEYKKNSSGGELDENMVLEHYKASS